MKNAKLLWAEDKIPEVPVAIDTELLDSLVRSRKFRSWNPSSPNDAPGGKVHPVKRRRHSASDKGPSETAGAAAKQGDSLSGKHYSPSELAKAWGVDSETIRNLFRAEPGVLKIGEKNPKHKRAYLTLRIPEAVAKRVHSRLSE
jgi:hypothetical protein